MSLHTRQVINWNHTTVLPMPAEVTIHVKALPDTQSTLPGLMFGNHDNRIIALDIKDDSEEEYLPDEPNKDDADPFYDDDIEEEEVNKVNEQGSDEDYGLNEIMGNVSNDNDHHIMIQFPPEMAEN